MHLYSSFSENELRSCNGHKVKGVKQIRLFCAFPPQTSLVTVSSGWRQPSGATLLKFGVNIPETSRETVLSRSLLLNFSPFLKAQFTKKKYAFVLIQKSRAPFRDWKPGTLWWRKRAGRKYVSRVCDGRFWTRSLRINMWSCWSWSTSECWTWTRSKVAPQIFWILGIQSTPALVLPDRRYLNPLPSPEDIALNLIW